MVYPLKVHQGSLNWFEPKFRDYSQNGLFRRFLRLLLRANEEPLRRLAKKLLEIFNLQLVQLNQNDLPIEKAEALIMATIRDLG